MRQRLRWPVRCRSGDSNQDVPDVHHDDDVAIGERDPRPSDKPRRVPLPWVTSPRELPFQTGERP